MHTRAQSLLSDAELRGLKDSLLQLRIDNEHDITRARNELTALSADHSLGSASLREVAGNADYMIVDAVAIIALIDAALDRMESGSYGICSTCGQPIPFARLELRPYGLTCVPCSS